MEEGSVGWPSSQWLRADCLDLGGNWQPEDLCGQEVSADHLCGRVCMQIDDGEGGMERETLWKTGLTFVSEAHGGAGEQGREAESHRLREATMMKRSPDKRRVWVRDTDGQEERGSEWQREGGKAVGLRRPSSPPPLLCSGEERLPKPSPR